MPRDRVLELPATQELERQINRKMSGIENSHKWTVFRLGMDIKEMGVTPKDAEYLGGLKQSLEAVCRAYKWPLDLVGGERTYENYNAAMKAAYTHAVIPEANWIASEITEQLVPLFPGEADFFEFDASGIEVLQEQKTAEWAREQGQLAEGAITVNEWRQGKGLDPVPWGDKPKWAQIFETQADDELPTPAEETDQEAEPERGLRNVRRVAIGYGSDEHKRLWQEHLRRVSPWERELTKVVTGLFEDQKKSLLDKLGSRSLQRADDDLEDELEDLLFDKASWVKKFRVKMRTFLRSLISAIGSSVIKELVMDYPDKVEVTQFDDQDALVLQYLERQSQRFASEVNETTWEALKKSLAEGIGAGEGTDKLAERVSSVMGDRIESTPEVIARTEVARATNGGKLLAYQQSGMAIKKTWLAALDDRTRESHIEAHNRYQASPIGLDEDFVVGAGAGPCPGDIGLAEEDIQCRCLVQQIVED